ncbi:vWA domain-containing protein [Chelativorans sp. YIM 93263]|uniref:vWA domain-containing protein n=1 Tax=Chelativorans sp. YIM 93263 TaxID=2906648 RepID=UPI0023784EDE|nr:VWA domain-containing protein [Chelativorans sp. YIM 93263]
MVQPTTTRHEIRLAAAFCLAALPVSASAQDAMEDALLADRSEAAIEAYHAFIDERGRDFEACFRDLPDLRDEGLGLSLRKGEEFPVEPVRVVVAMDASGSMAGSVGGEIKMGAAKSAAERFISRLPKDVEIGLLAFGHTGNNQESGRAESCQGVEMIAEIGSGREAISQSLAGLSATGWTPLASAIEQAGGSFSPSETPGEQVVYVVSDGEETCDGDPIAAARRLHDSDARAIVNIIGFDLAKADRAQLMEVAEAGGGSFVEARTGNELRQLMSDIQTQFANSSAMTRTRFNTVMGQSLNNLATNGMLTRTQLCIGTAGSQEAIGVATFTRQSGLDRETASEVTEIVRARRDLYQARLDEIKATAEAARDEANEMLQDDLDRLESESR